MVPVPSTCMQPGFQKVPSPLRNDERGIASGMEFNCLGAWHYAGKQGGPCGLERQMAVVAVGTGLPPLLRRMTGFWHE